MILVLTFVAGVFLGYIWEPLLERVRESGRRSRWLAWKRSRGYPT